VEQGWREKPMVLEQEALSARKQTVDDSKTLPKE